MSRTRVAVAVLAVALAAGGCTDDEPDDAPSGGGGAAWPSTDSPVASDGLAWAAGNDVHLADGSTISLEQEVGSYVVAGPGVFYFNADPDGAPFLLATPDGDVVETPADPAGLETSADGRWLGLIDQPDGENGPREVVVVDTTTGEEVVRTDEGVGASEVEDPDDMDWEDLYEDSPVEVVSIVDDTAYVSGLDDYYAWDLTTGEGTVVDEPVYRVQQPPWANPSGTWSIPAGQPFGDVTRIAPASGKAVRTTVPQPSGVTGPPLESWTLVGWLDDETALGLTASRDGFDVDTGRPVLLACPVPTGACEIVPGTELGTHLPLDRPNGLPPVYP